VLLVGGGRGCDIHYAFYQPQMIASQSPDKQNIQQPIYNQKNSIKQNRSK